MDNRMTIVRQSLDNRKAFVSQAMRGKYGKRNVSGWCTKTQRTLRGDAAKANTSKNTAATGQQATAHSTRSSSSQRQQSSNSNSSSKGSSSSSSGKTTITGKEIKQDEDVETHRVGLASKWPQTSHPTSCRPMLLCHQSWPIRVTHDTALHTNSSYTQLNVKAKSLENRTTTRQFQRGNKTPKHGQSIQISGGARP